MGLAWLAIVMLAGSVLFVVIHFADRTQKAALDRLSTYQIPPASEQK
jgi:hypothetical protein